LTFRPSAAFVPGGAGQTLAVDVISLTRSGNIRKAPAGNNPPTQLAGAGLRDDHKDQAVILTRQSDDITDPKFNLYLSDPIIATYNQNKDAASSPAPLILASENAVARLSLDNPANQGVTWLNLNQRLAARTISPYLGVDFVDMEGESIPQINPMSLELYQQALWKQQNPGQPLGSITVTNPVGVRLSVPNGLSDQTVDTIAATLYSHTDVNVQPQSYSLVETGPATLVFKSTDSALELSIVTTLDPDLSPPASPAFSSVAPEVLSVTATGTFHDQPVGADLDLLESGLDTRVFADQTAEVHLVLGNRDLPPSAVNIANMTVRTIRGAALSFSLTETAAGSRTFQDANQSAMLTIAGILNGMNIPAIAPTPDTVNSLYCMLTVPALGLQNAKVLLIEDGQDSPDYGNVVEASATTVNSGMGEVPVPSMDIIQQQMIPQKKFYIEVHDPSLEDNSQVTVDYTDYSGAPHNETLPLHRVDGLRWRTTTPMMSFGGPAFNASALGYACRNAKSALPQQQDSEFPSVPGVWAKSIQAMRGSLLDKYQRAFGQVTTAVSYVSLGDSLTAGVNGGQQVYYNQTAAYPKRLADMLGLPMTLPLFNYPGIPASRFPNALREKPSFDINAIHPGWPHRINPNFLCTDLGVSSSDAYDTGHNETMCGGSANVLGWLSGGTLESARREILENIVPGTYGTIERHAPAEWLQQMQVPPSLLTVWIGANDALGVAIEVNKIEGDDEVCEYNDPCGNRTAKNLTSIPKFIEYYKHMLVQMALAYWDPETKEIRQDVKPTIVVGLVPDVTVPPMLAPLRVGPGVKGDPMVFQPFVASDFRAWVRIPGSSIWKNLTKSYRDAAIRLQGNPQPDVDNVYGRMGVHAFLQEAAKKVILKGYFSNKPDVVENALNEVFGTADKPRVLNWDNRCDPGSPRILGEAEDVRATSARIEQMNIEILRLLYVNDDWGDNAAKSVIDSWRKEHRIHVLDTHSILSALAIKSLGTEMGPNEPVNQFNHKLELEYLAGQAGIQNGDDLQLIKEDEKATDAGYTAYFDNGLLTTNGQGGLFGADFIHPTWTGHAAVANALLELLKTLAKDQYPLPVTPTSVTTATPIALREEAQNDPWVPHAPK
jgi:hypothetical protein